MKYLVVDEYYNLEDEDDVLKTVYSIVEADNEKEAIMHDLANMMFESLPKSPWEKAFADGIVGCGTSAVYKFENCHTVGDNLIESVING